jgi:two-component system nitrate/nitrite response regulator NarL
MNTELMLVDDHPIVRDGLRRRFESVKHIHVVGEAGNSDEALRIAIECQPKLALVDIGLPGLDGIELTRLLRGRVPALSILIFSMYDDDDHITRSVRAGARGYVLKDAPMAEIIAAVDSIAAGGTYYTSAVVIAVKRAPTHTPLSPREQEILDHLIEGCSNKDIAKRLRLSVRTIETHRETIRRKLGAVRMVDLVKQALRFGLARL